MKLFSSTPSLARKGTICYLFVDSGIAYIKLTEWCDENQIEYKLKHTMFCSEVTVYCPPEQTTILSLTFC